MKKTEYLFIGISCFIMGFYFFGAQMFTSEASLIENRGTVRNSTVYYEKVKDKYGAESVRATLKISLFNNNKIYLMRENIGQCSDFKVTLQESEKKQINYKGKSIIEYSKNTSNCYSFTYEKINRKLKQNEEISIFINRNEFEDKEPYVYKIISENNNVLYTLKESKENPKFGFWIIMIFGSFEILMFLKINYGVKLKKILLKS